MNEPSPTCPACGGVATSGRRSLGSHGVLFSCAACGHSFLEQDSATPVLYNDHYVGFRDDPVFAKAARDFIAHDLRSRLPPPARLLDLGCGGGEFMSAARDSGYDVQGLDASDAAVGLCRSRGLTAERADFLGDDVARRYAGVDVVTMWDVIEHLGNPAAFIAQAARILRPGGLLFIKTPAIERLSVEVTRALPRLAGALLSSPAHIQFFRRTSMTALILRSGFRVIEWLPSRGVRGAMETGGLKKRLARRVIGALHRASGDGNLLLFARA